MVEARNENENAQVRKSYHMLTMLAELAAELDRLMVDVENAQNDTKETLAAQRAQWENAVAMIERRDKNFHILRCQTADFIEDTEAKLVDLVREFAQRDEKLGIGPLAREVNFGAILQRFRTDSLAMVDEVTKECSDHDRARIMEQAETLRKLLEVERRSNLIMQKDNEKLAALLKQQ
jgi:hypothetical protein